MPRFKETNPDQTVLLAVSFDRQILPGTFEHTLGNKPGTLPLFLKSPIR